MKSQEIINRIADEFVKLRIENTEREKELARLQQLEHDLDELVLQLTGDEGEDDSLTVLRQYLLLH